MIEDISSEVHVEIIIRSESIVDPIMIEILRKITDTKKGKTQEGSKAFTSTSIEITKPPLSTLTNESNNVTPPISSLKVHMVSTILSTSNDIRALSHSCSTISTLPLPSSTNITSSSSNTNLKITLLEVIKSKISI
jgi:hypothetical protein